MNTQLKDRRVLVTGASRGIGAAIAVELAREGADVVVNCFRSPEKARAVCEAIDRLGRRALVVTADVADRGAIDAMFDEVERRWGMIDILVNNAGIEPRRTIEQFDEATYDAIMATNLKGAFFCAQRAVKGMKDKGWGRIINISSVHEVIPHNACSVYSMSKAGMSMMTRELALAFSRFGVTVNSVAPGAIRTDINREVLSDPEYEARVIAKIPAGWIAEPDDVAQAVAFLASDRARYITGVSLLVDGGLSL